MKKSKILGIGLGCAALTAVAIATPVIATSCSNDEVITPITTEATILKTFGDIYTGTAKDQTMKKLAESEITLADKSVTVQTGKTDQTNNGFVGFVLTEDAKAIAGEDILKNNGFDLTKTGEEAVKLEWTFNNANFKTVANKNNAIYSNEAVANDSNLELTAILRQTGKESKSIKITVTFKLGDKA